MHLASEMQLAGGGGTCCRKGNGIDVGNGPPCPSVPANDHGSQVVNSGTSSTSSSLAPSPKRHQSRQTPARASATASNNNSKNTHNFSIGLRQLLREEANRELPNLPKVPKKFLILQQQQQPRAQQHQHPPPPPPPARSASALASTSTARLPRAAAPAHASAAPRDNTCPTTSITATRRSRSVSRPRFSRHDAPVVSRRPSLSLHHHAPAISRSSPRARPGAQTAPPSTSTPSKLPIAGYVQDLMDFFDSQSAAVDAAPFKRRSLSTDLDNLLDRRPSTSGSIYARPSSRVNTNRSTDLRRHDTDQYRYRSPMAAPSYGPGDSASVVSGHSTSSRPARRYSTAPDGSPLSPSRLRDRLRSPEVLDVRRRRPSFGPPMSSAAQSHMVRTLEASEVSPVEGFEPKQSESTSAESQQDDNVWDELDELKMRIKELEMKDKVPTVSSAAASGDSSDRPRTATTAPTTIDSSPKHERKQDVEKHKTSPSPPTVSDAGANSFSNIHPPLHTALAKAQSLLNASLYRTLEATANDALHLAAITGNAPSHGGNYPVTLSTNGASINDRHVRRKVDNMCRNLTELCIALCDGKHEAPDMVPSPTSLGTVRQKSPSIRFPQDRPLSRAPSSSRPKSRLDARRSSILGEGGLVSYESISPQSSYADMSVTEEPELVSPHSKPLHGRHFGRDPIEGRSRIQNRDDIGADERTNFRPPSRAMTDIAATRTRSRIASDIRPPVAQRTPSLREILASKRKNEAAYEANNETPRVSSYGSDPRRRRLFDQQSTPPVLEEDIGSDNYYTPSQMPPRRRVTSLASPPSDRQYGFRKSIGEMPARTPSINQRRHVITE